jgi:hypothetical protein
MRNVLINILLLASVASFGQVIVAHPFTVTPSAVTSYYEDDFQSRTSGQALAGQGPWEHVNGSIYVLLQGSDRIVYPASAGTQNAVYYDGAVANDQYSEGVIDAIAGARVGVAVRISTTADTYYYWASNTYSSMLVRRTDGTDVILDSGTAWSVTDNVRLEVSGYVLSAYRNEVLDTSIGTGGSYDDSASGARITSGRVGISAYGSNSGSRLDEWEGGSL